MKEKPDSFVDDRRLKAYPTEIGSQKFSPDDIQLFKIEKTSKLKHHFTSKFSELQSEEFLSIISPEEWGNKFDYIGTYEFLSDGRWIQSTL